MHILTFYTSNLPYFLPHFSNSARAFQQNCCNRYHFFTNRLYAPFIINKKSRYLSTYRAFLCCLLFTFFHKLSFSFIRQGSFYNKLACLLYFPKGRSASQKNSCSRRISGACSFSCIGA